MEILKHTTSPMYLSASVTLSALGTTAQPDQGRLNTVFRVPSIITEIGLSCRQATDATAQANIGGAARVRIRLGSFLEITQGFVPLYAFGSCVQRVSGETISSTTLGFSTYKWVLPKPLYVLPGMAMETLFERPATGASADVTAYISYSGFYLAKDAPVPKTFDVPFVANYNGIVSTASQISNSLQLSNPLREDLHIQRMIGRLRVNTAANDENEVADVGANVSPFFDTINIKMQHSDGWSIVPEYIPFYSLFGIPTRTFDAKFTLRPNDYVAAYIANNVTDMTPIISMIGHRQQVIS